MSTKGVSATTLIMNNNIHFWEPVRNVGFIRAVSAEFVAMFFFVFFSCGAAMGGLTAGNPHIMMVSATFGFSILCLAHIFGPVSGGHMNCAVSFCLFLSGRISGVRCACYTMAQMFGSIFGALFLFAIFGSHWSTAHEFGANNWDDSVYSGGQIFCAEMFGTMILLLTVLATIDIPAKDEGGPLGAFPIAMSVMIANFFLIPVSGCSINPTRSFGPAIVAQMAGMSGSYIEHQYVFWFAPLFAAFLTALLYEYGPLKPSNIAESKAAVHRSTLDTKITDTSLPDTINPLHH